QHIRNGFSAVAHFQGFAVVPLAPTFFAGNVYIRKEIHLNQAQTSSFAVFATAAFYVKTETPGFVSPDLGFGQLGKEFPDIIKNSNISGRIRSRGSAYRTLVYLYHL